AGLDASGSAALEATETTWPAELPPGAESLVRSIIWELPVGAGRVVVSGALGSWRYRESPASAFRDFWRRTIATAAAASPDPIEMAIDHSVVATNVGPIARVMLRDLALAQDLAGHSASVAATVDGPDGDS